MVGKGTSAAPPNMIRPYFGPAVFHKTGTAGAPIRCLAQIRGTVSPPPLRPPATVRPSPTWARADPLLSFQTCTVHTAHCTVHSAHYGAAARPAVAAASWHRKDISCACHCAAVRFASNSRYVQVHCTYTILSIWRVITYKLVLIISGDGCKVVQL